MGLKYVLEEKLETIRKLDELILEIKGKDIEKEIEDYGEFCEKVYSIFAKIDLSLEHTKNWGHVQVSEVSVIHGNFNSKGTESAKVKLPKLERKSFSGNYQRWKSFWDTFKSAVNGNAEINILKDRFGKPQLLISNNMDALLKLPAVNSVHETKKT